jgi:hypothetical protein
VEWLVYHFTNIGPLGDWFFRQGHESRYGLLAARDEDFQPVFHLHKIPAKMGFCLVDSDGHCSNFKDK